MTEPSVETEEGRAELLRAFSGRTVIGSWLHDALNALDARDKLLAEARGDISRLEFLVAAAQEKARLAIELLAEARAAALEECAQVLADRLAQLPVPREQDEAGARLDAVRRNLAAAEAKIRALRDPGT